MRADTHSGVNDSFMIVFEQAADGGLLALPFSDAEVEVQEARPSELLYHDDLRSFYFHDLPEKTGVSLDGVLSPYVALFGLARIAAPWQYRYTLFCTTSFTETLHFIEPAVANIEQEIISALSEMVQGLDGLVSLEFPGLLPRRKI